MIRSLAGGLFGALVLGAGSLAQASSLSFLDVFNPADVAFSRSGAVCTSVNGTADSSSASACRSLTWTHTLPGFNPLTDVLTGGILTLTLYDDDDPAAEKFDIAMDLLWENNQKVASTPSFNVITQLLDGALHVVLSDQNGDFSFGESMLAAEGTRIAASGEEIDAVPEPATLMMFGGGLLAFGAWLRPSARRS